MIYMIFSPSYKAPPTKAYPYYQDRFQKHRDSRILLNCPPQEKRPLLLDDFFIAEGMILY